MTSDSLLHRPTESLVLPNKRRFFPLRIPNFHTQLRHYISTEDPDRIYVVVDRIVYAIHISTQKRESIAVIPFEPRCLAAGHGWIAVGGPDNGACAYIRIDERGLQLHDEAPPPHTSDVDSALPLDLDPASGLHSPGTSSSETGLPRRSRRRTLPELVVHKFGGSIVNSVTIHRFPGEGENTSSEDIMILSNNDRTVTVYSLTRSKVMKSFIHTACMNYATVSPDKTILAAVGDENQVYFYRIVREWGSPSSAEAGGKLARWDWEVLPCIEMDIGIRQEDACCFTIAFSPSSHLCAIGSQSGVITVLDVEVIRKSTGQDMDDKPILHQFLSSRPCHEGGAVRCMTFSPEPWDLLVWLEGQGRAGVADVRQVFSRRQLLSLDPDDPALQELFLEPIDDESDGQPMEDDDPILPPPPVPRSRVPGTDSPNERGVGESESSSLRENLIQDLTERERLIMEFLNTARWTSRLEEGLTERPERPSRATLHSHPATRSRHIIADHLARNSRATPIPQSYDSTDMARDGDDDLFLPPPPPPPPRLSHINRSGTSERSYHARRQSSVVLSQGSRSSETGTSSHDRQPSVTLSWTTSPSELPSSSSEVTSRGGDPDLTSHDDSSGSRATDAVDSPTSPSLTMEPVLRANDITRIRAQRSSSTPRQNERPQPHQERRYDTSRLSAHEIRANLAAERLRRHRQIPSDLHDRSSHEREQRHRQQLLGFEQAHSPRWIRNIINDLPDRSLIHGNGADEPDATAGVGWGADGRSLYIATVEGIFEFQLNIHDRRTFPSFSYR